jgi:hypothetical protein
LSVLVRLAVVTVAWREAHASRALDRSAVQFHANLPFVAVNEDTLPNSPAHRWLYQVIPPAKTSTAFSGEFSSAIQAFVRSAVGSSAAFQSHRAQMDLRFGTFQSGGLSL